MLEEKDLKLSHIESVTCLHQKEQERKLEEMRRKLEERRDVQVSQLETLHNLQMSIHSQDQREAELRKRLEEKDREEDQLKTTLERGRKKEAELKKKLQEKDKLRKADEAKLKELQTSLTCIAEEFET